MLTLTKDEIQMHGGLLAALSHKSAEYIRSRIEGQAILQPPRVSKIQRIITHANPHVDEYFAVLLFRACLPPESRNIPLQEEVLYSHDNDALAKQLWPSAALFGVGATWNGGAKPCLIYDEHRKAGQRRYYSSCSNMVMRKLLGSRFWEHISPAINLVYGEVDHIDSCGNAHPLQLGTIVKDLHEVEFLFARGAVSRDDIRDALGTPWKQAIIEAVITAIIYSLENHIKLDEVDVLDKTVRDSIEHYRERTLLRGEPGFDSAVEFVRNNALNIKYTLRDAVQKRKDANGQLESMRDSRGWTIPQRLILPRIARACIECWGPVLGQVIMAHFWEGMTLAQLSFLKVMKELAILDEDAKDLSVRTLVGRLSFRRLSNCMETVTLLNRKTRETTQRNLPLWVLGLTSNSDVVRPNKPLQSYVNLNNGGLGLLFLESGRYGTISIFRGTQFPQDRWQRIIKAIQDKEGDTDNRHAPGCWHKTVNELGVCADFLLNGNKAHQYVPRTALDVETLTAIVKEDYRRHATTARVD